MNIKMTNIEEIKPYQQNPRINDKAVDAVANSLKEFSWRQPIVVDSDGVIICGHTRWKAAKKLGLAKVPVHVAKDLKAEQIKAFRIADNKTADLAEWDMELLPIELGELRDLGFDMDLIGFSDAEMATLLNPVINEGLTDEDAIPEPPDEAVTQKGDIWILGSHRLMCGDSAKPEDLDRLLDGATIDLVNSDPPYNVKVEPRSNNAIAAGMSKPLPHLPKDGKVGAHKGLNNHQNFDLKRGASHPERAAKKLRPKDRPLANDFISDEAFDQILLDWFGNASRVLKPGGSFYIWGGYANLGNYPGPLKASGLYFSQAIVWDKQHPVLTRKTYMGAFEIAFFGWKEGAGHKFYGPNNATDLWHVKKIPPQQMEHLTAKPAELAVRAIQYSSKPGENILDLFGGSGSTLIGCEQTGRNAFLMELDELYCDVIVDRFQRFSGTPAILEHTGKSPIPMKPREENMR